MVKQVFLMLYCIVSMVLVGCGDNAPTEKMIFRNEDYASQVVNMLIEKGVSFEQTNETTIEFFVHDSSAVLDVVKEIDTGIPLMYTVYGIERKRVFEEKLDANNVQYKVYSTENSGYSFLIDSKYKKSSMRIFDQIK